MGNIILGIDIGGTNIKAGLVENEALTNKNCYITPQSIEKFCEQLREIIEYYLQISPFSKVAFSVPGSVNKAGTVLFGGAVPYLNGINLKKLLADSGISAEVEVSVENDAKAATLGEMGFGNLRDVNNGLALILGTGVGMGICINGQLYKGGDYHQAGEISFWIRDRSIHDIDSFVGVGFSAVKLIALLAECLHVENDGPKVFKALQASENKVAEKIFSSYCEGIAILCFNLQTILDVEKIVIGGGISQQSLLIDKIQEAYQHIFMTSPIIQKTLRPILIEAAKFKADANLIGAARKENS